ncbi:sensor histidine kinase [Aureivirga sp. CE67]|uniref:sensor histidine kinase n=1 Tax=Aureivirga sp. CE67 TaxID=1788983 RepID=UPI0018CAAE6F|nr:HAMP domain-containing sensor histidine kinase [Aureivirga sp. CE67]
MDRFKEIFTPRKIVAFISLIVVALILWNTYDFFQKFKQEERSKMEILAGAFEKINTIEDLDADVSLYEFIIKKNINIPMIVTDIDGQIDIWRNLKITENKYYTELDESSKEYLNSQLRKMQNENEPIHISFVENKEQIIYYRNSDLLNKLTFYPIALIFILFLFSTVIYLFFKSSKIAEQNKLWTGMAKETAHQIGTPLSSLVAWIELLKFEDIDETIVPELEKDVNRLNTIAERFSKIGSVPVLENRPIKEITQKSIEYLQSRVSKQVKFTLNLNCRSETQIKLNEQLFGWVIENLVKNAIDAMQGKGALNIDMTENSKFIEILITDTGKGIPKALRKKVFSPGFTTKKRGWGLGLSLAKRIINDYHKGKISIKKSEVGKGTTFSIILKKEL